MQRRKILLLLVAGLVAIVTVMIARSSMTPATAPATAPVEAPVTQILAASKDLPTGSILKDGDTKWVPWPKDADTSRLYLKGAVEMASLNGAVVRDSMKAGDPMMQGHVVQPHDQGFLAAVLTPGMRAMAVTLTPSGGVAGFIFPGDRVDVVLTHSFSRKDISDLSERRVSETVLSDVRVLALDQKSDSQSIDPKVAQLATLEVSPKQAEKLALAQDLAGQGGMARGALSLVLRSLATEEAPDASHAPGPTWDSDVSQAYPNVNGDDGLIQKVQIMRGKDVTETNFERHH